MRIRLKGINSVRKRLADGSTKTFYYAWKSGPPLRGDPGTPEFVASYNEAVARKREVPRGGLLSILQQYQQSDAFQGLAVSTRRSYVALIQRIEQRFSDFPLTALSDPRTRGVLMKWRDDIAAASGRRQADYAWTVLARVLSWAFDRGLVSLIRARTAVGFTAAARGSTTFGPLTTKGSSSHTLPNTCTWQCCSRSGLGNGKAIFFAFPGPPMTAPTFDFGSPKVAVASSSQSERPSRQHSTLSNRTGLQQSWSILRDARDGLH